MDRDADTRLLYGDYLKQSSYEIEEAEDGREALAKALTHLPDIIVTETRLPGISGYELCRLLREDALTRRIPIVVVTADAFETAISRAHHSGADAVLVKPCLPERLAEELARVLSGTAQRPEAIAARVEVTAPAERVRRTTLSRAHRRGDTTAPALTPPVVVCPVCDLQLTYVKSHLGGVSARPPEQWDDYECANGCGIFQYRHRTRKLRRVS